MYEYKFVDISVLTPPFAAGGQAITMELIFERKVE